MRILCDCEIICTRIHNISACAVRVIGPEFFFINNDFNRLRLSRFKGFCLLKSHQFNRCFLYKIFPVIICVRRLEIQFHHLFSGSVPDICHIDRNCECIVPIVCKCEIAIREICVAKAVAERELHFFAVIPCSAVCRTDRAVSAALAEHRILISCLIVAVAYINILSIDRIRIFADTSFTPFSTMPDPKLLIAGEFRDE